VIVENVNRMKKWNRHNELVGTIEDLGYTVNDLYLNSSDFGSAQARKRMFLVCDREGSIVTKDDLLLNNNNPPMSARDIIDWKGEHQSDLLYKKGRASATMERAECAVAALGKNFPFIIVYYGSDYAGGWQTLDAPLRTVTTIDRFGLVTWRERKPYLRMLQPNELVKAMGGGNEHTSITGVRE
jgi:DNA (cytosine-5)-methyltransferase 1